MPRVTGGQILLSRSTYALLVDDILPDIGFRDLGDHRLRDLERPERIYQLTVPDLPSNFPPLNSLGRLEPFAGREQELAQSVVSVARGGRLRVIVADDTPLLREGLVKLLEDAGFEIVGHAADGDELLELVATTCPDAVITDMRMPPTHTDEGLVAAERIRREFPEVAVRLLSQYLDRAYAVRLLEEFPERAGYLLKERVADIPVLADTVRRLADGECVVDPTIISMLKRGACLGGDCVV